MSIQDDDCNSYFSTLQAVTVGTGQTVGFRTQQGEVYGKNAKCKVNFKVSKRFNISVVKPLPAITERQLLPFSGGLLSYIRCASRQGELQRPA